MEKQVFKDVPLIECIDYFERILIDGKVIGTYFELDEDEKAIYDNTIRALKSLLLWEVIR